jgi:hypothetical protein
VAPSGGTTPELPLLPASSGLVGNVAGALRAASPSATERDEAGGGGHDDSTGHDFGLPQDQCYPRSSDNVYSFAAQQGQHSSYQDGRQGAVGAMPPRATPAQHGAFTAAPVAVDRLSDTEGRLLQSGAMAPPAIHRSHAAPARGGGLQAGDGVGVATRPYIVNSSYARVQSVAGECMFSMYVEA